MAETRKQRYQRLLGALKTERTSFESQWRDLSSFIKPNRARFVRTDVNRGDRRWQKIIDSTGTFSARTLSSGMMSGVTSPARPWFRLTTPDPELAEFAAVKEWLHDVGERMTTVFLRSNLYNKLPIIYADMGVFATGALSVMQDDDTVIRCFDFPVGSYWVANDAELRVRVFAREYQMTVRQVVTQFGRLRDGTPDWSVFSTRVRNLWERGQYEDWVDVVHVIDPNPEHNPSMLESRFKRFRSCYYEPGGEQDVFLEERGFDEFPVLAPRWEVAGFDVYGTDCPGMTALGDIKQLQHGEKRGAQGLDKMIDPPMTGPSSLKNARASILPGDITYLDVHQGQQGFQPAYLVNLPLDKLEAKQQQVRLRIQRAFYEDLFLMLAQSDRREITAREIDERHEEKLLALGPVLEQLNQDLLDPLIDRTFAVMARRGLIPPPPRELEGMALKVEYISVMAQAQKMVGLAGVERFTAYVSQLAQVDEQVMDKVNRDELVDVYGTMTGVPPKVIVPDEDVAAIRQARAEAQQAQAQAEMAAQLAPAAKQLSETDTSKPSALTQLAGAVAGGAGG